MNKKSSLWFSTIVICLMCVTCISCSDKEEPYLTLKTESISLKSTGEASEPLVIESNTSWMVTTNESWLKPSVTEGNGNATIELKADPNPLERDRKVSIIVTAGEITKNLWIIQGHDELTVSGEINLTEEEGASGKFNIEAKIEWSVTDVPDWLELSATNGTGNAEVTVTAIQRNYEDEPRSVSLKVTSGAMQKYIHVKQANTYLEITSGSSLTMKYYSGDTGKFFISTNGSWSITVIPSWLKVSQTEGSGDKEIKVTTTGMNVTEDDRCDTIKISVGSREALVTVIQTAGSYVRISAPVVLSNGCYFEYDLGAVYKGFASILYDASYFDSQMNENSAYSEVTASEKALLSERNFDMYNGLPASSSLVLCVVPYREQSGMVRWGNLHTVRIKTASASASSGVTISEIGYNSSQWTVTIYPSGSHYYLMSLKNADAVSAVTDSQPDILYAAAMYRNDLTSNKIGDLYTSRSYSDYALYLIGWGGTSFGNITRKFRYIYGSPQHAQVTPQTGPKYSKHDNAEFERLQETLRQNNNVKMQIKVPLR